MVQARRFGGSVPQVILGKRQSIGRPKGEAVLFVDMNVRNQTTGDEIQWIGFCIEKSVGTPDSLCAPHLVTHLSSTPLK